MYIKCGSGGERGFDLRGKNLLPFLRENNLINKRGETREEIKIYWGGPFFQKSEEDSETIPWTFSTFDKDRDQERIDQKGWDLEHYLKNPVILWSHDSQIPAIGYAKEVDNQSDQLGGLIKFNDKDYDPFGWAIGQRVKAGVIRAGSVGFLIHKIEIHEEAGKESLIFREQELLEFSICNVPSNPFALNQKRAEPRESTKNPNTPRRFYGGFIGTN